MLALLLGLTACNGTDTGEPVVDPSQAETDDIFDIQVAPSAAVPTAIEVSWSTSGDATSWVEYGDDLGQRTPVGAAGTAHSAVVIGAEAAEILDLKLVAEIDGTQHESEVFNAEAGFLPSMPSLQVDVLDAGALPDGVLIAALTGDGGSYLAMIDMSGAYIWGLQITDETGTGSAVDLTWAGDGILYNTFSTDHSVDAGTLYQLDLAGNEVASWATPEGHHAFQELPDGSLTYLAADVRDAGYDDDVVGDRVVALSPDGTTSDLFSTWDFLAVTESQTWHDGFYPQGYDWTHANAMKWSVERETFLLSMGGTNQIAEITRDGDVLAIFPGAGADPVDYTLESNSFGYGFQHGPSWAADGSLLVFSNNPQSAAVAYQVDEGAREISQSWIHGADYSFQAFALGGIEELPGGEILVNWGSAGVIELLGTDRQPILQIALPVASWASEVHYLPSPYERY